MTRPLLHSLLFALVLASPAAAQPNAKPGLPDYRIVFRYRASGPISVKDYESEVAVYARQSDGSEKLVGAFTGSIFPDDMQVRGRVKDGCYDLYLGLHRRSKDGKAQTPSKADLVVKSQGWLRPALIVNADAAVPVHCLNPQKKTSTYIHLHNGYGNRRWSEGCLTLTPDDWTRFITIFLERYTDLVDWHADGKYYGRKVAVLEVQQADSSPPVRIDSGVSGHIHPALCVTKKGTLIAVYCQSEYQPYLIVRSTDGGKTWSKPALFPETIKTQVYPGSLTTLADGRLLHAWNVWFSVAEKVRSRYVAFSISSDDGLTWSKPKSLAKNKDPKTESVIRHPIVELSPTAWLFPLMDRTIVYNPQTGQESPFADGRNHGLVPIVRTAKGTLISGKGLRSTDGGKQWQEIKPFPDVSSQGWRHELIALKNGWLLASQIVGPGVGGGKIQFIVSRDDGKSWHLDHPIEFYNPGRAIGGRACPRTVEIDEQTLGTIFYDVDAKQSGGSGVFFRTTARARLAK
jgi:hypothetical protein